MLTLKLTLHVNYKLHAKVLLPLVPEKLIDSSLLHELTCYC